MEADRARELYLSGDQLLPYIDEDSRPALWVLVTTYRRLLEKIAATGYNVFADKIRLSSTEKLAILGKGFLRRLLG
jgi:phytoene synthase